MLIYESSRGYSSVWESDALALRRSAVRSRLSPPLFCMNIGNYIVEQTRKKQKTNSKISLELAVKKNRLKYLRAHKGCLGSKSR